MKETINLIESIEIYKKSLQSDKKSENTITSYSTTLSDFLDYANQQKNINVLKIAENQFKTLLHEYIINKIEYRNFKNDKQIEYKASSLNSKRSCMRNFVKKLYVLGRIENDFSSSIESVKMESGSRKRVLTHDEIDRVSKILNDDVKNAKKEQIFLKIRNKYIFWFFILTGIRISELAKVKWDNIDMHKDEIIIYKSKGKKTRIIDLMKELKLMLYEYRDNLKTIKSEGYNIESPYLFTKYRSPEKPMNSKTIYIIIVDVMKRAGIFDISPHNLRHTYVSYGIAKNVNPSYLARQAGHASPEVLYKIYTHEIDRKQREMERRKMEQAFNKEL